MIEPELRPHPGPPTPPASAAGVGLRHEKCLRYRVDARTDLVRLVVSAALPDRPIAADDELVWEFFPAFDDEARDVRDGFRAASVAVDLVLDDGRRLLEVEPLELDGLPSAPRSRHDIDVPDQWNQRRISLSGCVGARVVSVDLVIDPPAAHRRVGMELIGWLDGIRLETSTPLAEAEHPADRVLTTRGSHSSPDRSRGLTQPATAVPHGAIQLAPATRLDNTHWTYSWNAHGEGPDPVLAGLLVSRSPSIWIGDRGALGVRIGLEGDGEPVTRFRHDHEIARPHRYRVDTLDGIRVDATASDSAVRVRTDLPAPGRVLLCAPGSSLVGLDARRSAPGVLRIAARSTVPSPHDVDPLGAYYAVILSTDASPTEQLISSERPDGLMISAPAGSLSLTIGTSQISLALAENAARDAARHSLDALADAARERWDTYLGTVEVDGSDEQRALVASDLYRLFLFPSRHDEDTPGGPRYPSPTRRLGPDTDRDSGRSVRAGRMLTNNGFWDTYRTAWPAYALLAPGRAGELLDGMLEHVRDAGWSPRWTAGTPLDAMVGTSLDVIAADLVSAEVPGIDLRTAYSAALRNATCGSGDPRFGRRELTASLVRGWVSSGTDESVSWTMEGAIADAGAAVLARALARSDAARSDPARRAALRAEARFFAHRALAYRNLWDDTSRFFRPRTARGRWADSPFDPRRWGAGHTETNAWGSRFSAPHDGGGLAQLFGGPAALGDALDASFGEPETGRARFAGTYGRTIHEMVEARDIRRGMWAPSNQPAHHVPWMYAHTDRPWRTNEILADAALRLFRGIRMGQGYPGDEDNGEMSAWHLLTVLGLAPFQPGSGSMLWTAPQVPEARVRPLGGAELRIRTRRRDASDRYIRAVSRDGQEWMQPDVPIAELREGGVWQIDLGPKPVAWSEPLPTRPFFAPDGVETIALRSIALRPVRPGPIGPGEARRIRIATAVAVADEPLLVIGLRESGRHSFRVRADGLVIARFVDEKWRWPEQARPFEVPVPLGARTVALEWEGPPATLTLVQLLGPEPRR